MLTVSHSVVSLPKYLHSLPAGGLACLGGQRPWGRGRQSQPVILQSTENSLVDKILAGLSSSACTIYYLEYAQGYKCNWVVWVFKVIIIMGMSVCLLA